MAYIPYPVTVDVDGITAQTVADLQARLGVTLNEGDPAVALAEVAALREAESRVLMADVAAAIFRGFGMQVAQVTPVAAAPATTTVQFTVADTAGYTIPSGTRLAYRVTGSQVVGLATTAALTIAPGGTTGTVAAEALVAGTAANGLVAASVTLLDPLSYVTAAATTATTSGGVDAETALEYADRLRDELTLMSRVPRLEAEFALVARRIAGVHRARAIRGYDADTDTSDTPGHVTVAVVDADGAAVASGIKADVEAELETDDRRAVGVVVHVVDPTTQAIAVDFTAVAEAGADPVVVEAAAIAAVEAYLSPATWGATTAEPRAWQAHDVVRYLEIAAVLDRVPGLDYVSALTLDAGTADVTLTGIAVLPDATVTGAVT